MTTKLFLTGIGCEGHHGANPGEKVEAQPFVVDLDLDVETTDDHIANTADYRTIVSTVRGAVGGTSFDLLESLAAAVADAVLALPRVVRATAVVHKPNAARSVGIQGVAAAVTRGGE